MTCRANGFFSADLRWPQTILFIIIIVDNNNTDYNNLLLYYKSILIYLTGYNKRPLTITGKPQLLGMWGS